MKYCKRVVNPAFWDDDMVSENFTPEDKYFFLTLLTSKYTNQLGIFHLPVKKIAFDMGYSVESVRNLIDRFANKYHRIFWSQETSEVAIKNYLRHSIVSGGKPVRDCLIKEEREVVDKELVIDIVKHLNEYNNEYSELNATVREFISYIYNIYNIDNCNNTNNYNENDNDNDNERYVNESSTNRQKTPVRNVIPPSVDDVEAYCKERGNGIDANNFCDFYTARGWKIGNTKMKDWQAAVRTWEKRDGVIPVKEPVGDIAVNGGWE